MAAPRFCPHASGPEGPPSYETIEKFLDKGAPHTSSTVNILPAPQCRSVASRRPNRTGTLLRRFQSGTTQPFSGTLCLRDLYRLELAAIDGDARCRQQADL